MSSELTVALIGAGSAIAGALVGGAAAVVAASRAARSAYLGPLHVAQRTAQQQAYAKLVNAANDFETGTRAVSGVARVLMEDASDRSEGIPSRLNDPGRQRRRDEIRAVLDDGQVRAAVRLVGLEGPTVVAVQAIILEEAVRQLANVLRKLEEVTDEEGRPRPTVTLNQLRGAYDRLAEAISRFAYTARENGGHGADPGTLVG